MQLDPLFILLIQFVFLSVTGVAYMAYSGNYKMPRKLLVPFIVMRVAFVLYFLTLFYSFR